MSNIYPDGPEYALLIFSSHRWAYGHHRNGLHNLLSPEWVKGVDYHDLSVPGDHPLHFGDEHDRLVQLLEDRIRRSDVVLIMAGMYATHSHWMEIEAQIANDHGKPILAIAPNAQQRLSSLATGFSQYPPVRWRGESIRREILGVINPSVCQNYETAKAWRNRLQMRQPLRPVAPRPPYYTNALADLKY